MAMNGLLLATLVAYSLAGAIAYDNFNSFFSISIFFLLLYWPLFLEIDRRKLEQMIFIYGRLAVITAFFLIIQVIASRFYGYDFFYHEKFGGGRLAYGFIWKDFSFLSLYLVSAIPLLRTRENTPVFFLYPTVLIIGSILTSARTGIAALFIFYVVCVLKKITSIFLKGRVNKGYFLLPQLFFLFSVYLAVFFESLTGRKLTVSGSGRVEGFSTGWDFFLENWIFGVLFNKNLYAEQVAVVPHNVFISVLYMGGMVVAMIFLFWGMKLMFLIRRSDTTILSSVWICLIGFQFIPSFFSAYFFAIILSLGIISEKINRQRNKA